MESGVNDKPDGFRETRILIVNSSIASKQATLQRVNSELNKLLEKKAQIETEIYQAKEIRDALLLQRWGDGEPEWQYILENPARNSHILAKRGEDELSKLGLFTAGIFERNQQKAIGIAIPGETTDEQLSVMACSLEKIFPHLYALTDGERAVIVSHNKPESFNLQIRQLVSNKLISLAMFSYGTKQQKYFGNFHDVVTFIRNNMSGSCYLYELPENLGEEP